MNHGGPRVKIKQDTLEWRLLNFIGETGKTVIDAAFPKRYAENHLLRLIFGLDKKSRHDEQKRRMRRIISRALHRLSAKGLIQKQGRTRRVEWQLSAKGRKILYFPPQSQLPPEDRKIRIVIFDIPEAKKRDREWLRRKLVENGFVMLQKSVWIGKRPLPERLIKEFGENDIFDAVHIFEIKESGTLQNLEW